jgi:serine/threonine protein kinase
VRLEDYEKLKAIGGAAFGAVYSARQNGTGVVVAVKELALDAGGARATGERF